MILIAIEVASEVGVVRHRTGRRLLALGLVGSVALNIGWMIVWGNHLRQESSLTGAGLAALDIAGPGTRGDLRPSRNYALVDVTAAEYFAAVRRFDSSPAYSVAELRRSPAQARALADSVLVRALGVRAVPGHAPTRGGPPIVERQETGRAVRIGSCLRTPGGVIDIVPRSPAGIGLDGTAGAGIVVQARRFGDGYRTVGALAGGDASVATPLGAAGDEWHLRVASTGPARICSRR